MTYKNGLAENLKSLRLSRGVSQQELAKDTGISPENGPKPPDSAAGSDGHRPSDHRNPFAGAGAERRRRAAAHRRAKAGALAGDGAAGSVAGRRFSRLAAGGFPG